MISWVLGRLEQNPLTVFSASELVQHDARAFEALKRDGLVFQFEGTAQTIVRRGRLLSVDETPIGYMAYDEADPEFGPLHLSADDVQLWQFDAAALMDRIATEYGLRGQRSEVSDRIWCIGELNDVPFYLSWIPNDAVGERELMTVRAQIHADVPGIVAICPTWRPRPSLAGELDRMHVQVANLGADPVLLDPTLESLLGAIGNKAPSGVMGLRPFRYTPDFRWVELDGVVATPGLYQGMVLRRMHELHRPATQTEIMGAFDGDFQSKRIVDLFDRSPLWGSFLLREKARYSLAHY